MTAQDALLAAGPQAAQIGELWNLTLALCTLVFGIILAILLIALWRAPRATADTPPDLSHLTHPEPGPRRSVIAGLALSIAGLLVLLVASLVTDRALAQLTLRDALHIELTGHQWWWSARYDDPDASRVFDTANELHIPVGRPVIVTLRSADVIHSLWVPNLAGKKDLIPGRTATLTLRADRAGVYRGQCAEFCGHQHAWMALLVVAEPAARFEAWAEAQRQPAATPSDALALRGQQVFLGSTCVMCHAIGGTDAGARNAPDLSHLAGRRMLAAGALPNDALHLAAWITDPQAHKPGVNMPAHAFAQPDLEALVAYLRSLQ
ncbi:MAG TPA: cytochrome c oxidase subunit II [Albitalea sp.]|uniref:cytochrome c oxidase subunit II n=1 Tax=Piscinibacter sp. TaxID=1903157 RepID=UPI002ECFC349